MENEIYNLLNSGWIYCVVRNDYYGKILNQFETTKVENMVFVKKSEKLYYVLKNLGVNPDTYDSIVIIIFDKTDTDFKINVYSLGNGKKLKEITQDIINGKYE
jgi:hypothetical protein